MTLEELKEFSAIYHHKFVVLQHLNSIIQELIKRAESHDNSKFSEDEFSSLVQGSEEIRKHPYGSPEYEEMRKKWSKLFEIHYKKNPHHPENHEDGIDGMTLVDLIEMLVDWKAASLRSGHKDITTSIKIGTEKFNINPQLVKILENTARAYKM